jgi:hypothetical protein
MPNAYAVIFGYRNMELTIMVNALNDEEAYKESLEYLRKEITFWQTWQFRRTLVQ